MSTPDVCLISPYPPRGERHGGHSGVASYTANLAHALAGEGAGVAVVAPRLEGEPDRTSDGPVQVLRRVRSGGPSVLPAAALAAGQTGAPAVHLQHETFLYGGPASAAGLAPALAALRARRATVVTMHHVVDPRAVDADFVALHRVSAPVPLARAGMAAIRSSIARLADAVVVHEPGFAGVVDGARVVPHGVEPGVPAGAADAATAQRTATFRASHGLDDGRLTVLCFGFLAPYKGLERVLEAGRLAAESVHVVVAGGEHPRMEGPGGYADELRAQHGDHATFTGRVDDADVAACFGAADLAAFLYPQPVSSSGALALALAHRTPMLVSRELAGSAGVPDALVAPSGAPALAARLRDLAVDGAARAALRDVAAELLAGRTWPAVARTHLDLYAEVSHSERGPRWSLRAA
ncbi:MAG TPA: glycosyltransferase [Baekduia sp.]|uniref:glycosyltransferase n=1 Tax=Baekduia sp. TaxID=2600305 RepID=UPI002CADD8A5|nr:glycosyltransferase [Baekduia sp.]HMJ37237.1 glycosyltransferase [Baekduia sp.]